MFLKRSRKTNTQTVVQCGGEFYETSCHPDAVFEFMHGAWFACTGDIRTDGFVFLDKPRRRPEDVQQFALRVKDIQAVIPSYGFSRSIV